MGVITKYALKLGETGLKVSNHIFSGEIAIDAEVSAEMINGWPGSAFKLTLTDLPDRKLKEIQKALADKATPLEIELGYYEGPFGRVMEGVADDLSVAVKDNKLVATLKGLEKATAALKQDANVTLDQGADLAAAVRRVLEGTGVAGEVQESLRTLTLPHRVSRGKRLQILDELARIARAELLVVDGKAFIGRPVRRDDYTSALVPDENLAEFQPFAKALPEEEPKHDLVPLPADTVQGFRFVVVGDPKLRPGHRVKPDVADYAALAGTEFRVASVVHSFSLAGGYVCTGIALKPCADDGCREERERVNKYTPDDIARRLSKRVAEEQKQRPFVEVGQVKSYRSGGGTGGPGHRATLSFGQKFPGNETQPSVDRPVEDKKDQVFTDKPLASVFAWNKCGLVVPVYPGMKALLHHNLGLANDPVIGGFLWSREPSFEPPANRDGDYWLCLPIDFDGAQPPTDSTRAVNDLTTSTGLRVIQAKGLRLTIGGGRLGTVGVRPDEGAADELLIEHGSGTVIKVASDGTLSFKASKVEIEGDVAIKGNVEIT